MSNLNETTFARKEDFTDDERDWYHVEATNLPLGRLASRVAHVLMGKHRPNYTRHVDVGDHIVITHAGDVRLTGKKTQQESLEKYTDHPSGRREKSLGELREEAPDVLIKHAVKGMLPKSSLGADMLKKLHVYEGEEHPHQAQQPEEVSLDELPG